MYVGEVGKSHLKYMYDIRALCISLFVGMGTNSQGALCTVNLVFLMPVQIVEGD